jgi:hypothetical protein
MLNCKIRLLEDYLGMASKGETITFIDGESHYPNGFKGADNYTSLSDFSKRNRDAKFEVIEEDHPAFQGWNATIKCVYSFCGSCFEKGKIYHIKKGAFVENVGGMVGNSHYSSLEKLNKECGSHFELVTEPDSSRICSVLCPEKPLKDREEFIWKGTGATYRINKGHMEYKNAGGWNDMTAQMYLEEMINCPDSIIRRPQFSDDEKAFFKAFHSIGFNFWIRIRTGVFACTTKPIPKGEEFDFDENERVWALPEATLPHLTLGNMVDASDYLESEESK